MKLCTVCGVVTSRARSRCTERTRESDRSRHNALCGTRGWHRVSARVLRAWRGEHGNWCRAYQRDAHPAVDLTVDHVVPLAAGGAPYDIGNTSVLCRSCNSTKGASTAPGGVAHVEGASPLTAENSRRLSERITDGYAAKFVHHDDPGGHAASASGAPRTRPRPPGRSGHDRAGRRPLRPLRPGRQPRPAVNVGLQLKGNNAAGSFPGSVDHPDELVDRVEDRSVGDALAVQCQSRPQSITLSLSASGDRNGEGERRR